MNEVMQLISNVGFPIVACVYLGQLITKTLDSMKEVIASNTLAIEKLATLITVREEE